MQSFSTLIYLYISILLWNLYTPFKSSKFIMLLIIYCCRVFFFFFEYLYLYNSCKICTYVQEIDHIIIYVFLLCLKNIYLASVYNSYFGISPFINDILPLCEICLYIYFENCLLSTGITHFCVLHIHVQMYFHCYEFCIGFTSNLWRKKKYL